jgi:hypothetical protein
VFWDYRKTDLNKQPQAASIYRMLSVVAAIHVSFQFALALPSISQILIEILYGL